MRLTRPGAVVIAILVACAVVLVMAHGAAQFVAAAVGLIVLLLLAGEGLGGTGYGGDAVRKREVLGRQARRRRAPIADDEPEQPVSGLVSRRRRDPG